MCRKANDGVFQRTLNLPVMAVRVPIVSAKRASVWCKLSVFCFLIKFARDEILEPF